MRHLERHRTHRTGWLRAAVLGANDGILSTASLIVGVAASGSNNQAILLAGVASLVAGALAMAAGEYVSVSSQADTESADLQREAKELADNPQHELAELTEIYVRRGLEKSLAQQVATQLMSHDALGAHAKEELGITEALSARPTQAALFSAASFALGALLPLAIVWLQPSGSLNIWVAGGSLLGLALLGWMSAITGGARATVSVARVVFLGALAMGATAAVGMLFGTQVA